MIVIKLGLSGRYKKGHALTFATLALVRFWKIPGVKQMIEKQSVSLERNMTDLTKPFRHPSVNFPDLTRSKLVSLSYNRRTDFDVRFIVLVANID